MKFIGIFILFIICPMICKAQLLDDSEIGNHSYGNGKMFRKTRSALMKYDFVQQKTEYWGKRLEKMLLGEYAKKLLIIAPLVTGKLQFSALDLNFYIDTRSEKSGVKYTYNF